MENELGQHSQRLSSKEQKLEAIATRLAQLEGALLVRQLYNKSWVRSPNRFARLWLVFSYAILVRLMSEE
ncbi:hypothetical protein LC612_35570 [Nostoc sp. CHAB 5834]|nr:hypothetical protein [Nostoc sp. CHAB 5834]